MELSIAREIQMGILPSDLSSCTNGTGLDIHAVLEPAQQVGGDLYEVLRAGEHRVMVVLGDVSGKGIPAALFMAVTVTLVRSDGPSIRAPRGDRPACERRTRFPEPAQDVRHNGMPYL